MNGRLTADPRVALLSRAWGLFYATGEEKYLRLAYETGGNPRARRALQQSALEHFLALQTRFTEYWEERKPLEPSPCLKSFLNFSNSLRKLQEELPPPCLEVDEEKEEISLAKEPLSSEENSEERELEKLFDRISSKLLRK